MAKRLFLFPLGKVQKTGKLCKLYAVYIYLCTIHSNIKVHLKLTQLVASKPS